MRKGAERLFFLFQESTLHFIDDEINAWNWNVLLKNLIDRKEFIEIPG